MSICAQVKLNTAHGVIYDTDPNDIIYAFCDNECVGMEKISFNEISHTSKVFLTVFGTDSMNHKPIHFQLWQASTGKIYDMTAVGRCSLATTTNMVATTLFHLSLAQQAVRRKPSNWQRVGTGFLFNSFSKISCRLI